jgi:hypothetical protein
LLSNFNTLEAPILTLNTLNQNELIYIVSGVIPNKKAQPIIDEWIGVRFIDDKFDSIVNFEELLEITNLNTKKFPNSANEFDTTYIKVNLPFAIERAKDYIISKRDIYDDEMSTKILEKLEELDNLKQRHLGVVRQLEFNFGQESKKLEKEAEINKIFEDYHNWIKDTMEIESEPFIQIIATLRGNK